MILFGGMRYDEPSDHTWLSDPRSNRWTVLRPAGPVPDARWFGSMAYDPVGDRMVLFGGRVKSGEPPLDDTWVFGP